MEPSELIKSFVHYDVEMEDFANQYANFVIANVSIEEKKGNKPFVILEQQLEMDFDSDAKGTLDCGIISNGTLTVIDLKTGRLKVDAFNAERGIFNTQLGIYALYAYKTFKDLFPIERVKLVIFQPRLNSVSDYEMELQELLDFETNILIPAVAKTKEAVLEAHVNSGCQYCAGKAICAERNKALEKVDSKKPIQTLSDEEINKILPFLDEIISYCESLKEFALKKALNGFKWEGLKLVHDNA
ncbi:MAG: DUF2800 domain-containing protein [Bacilli bacterium]|nr:DUF2800 domain-containing protein [Bacilli bacterium]